MRSISLALLLLGCLSLTAAQFGQLFNLNQVPIVEDPTIQRGCDFQPDIEGITLDESLVISNQPDNRCLVGPTGENCVSGTGPRKLVRFTTVIENKGTEDCIVGPTPACPAPGIIPPDQGPFHFATCHKHWHLQNYADYYLTRPMQNWQAQGFADQCQGTPMCKLGDTNCRIISGHKTGFCLMDSLCGDGLPEEQSQAKYVCTFQGITAGCMDAYVADLPCQWIDVTALKQRFNEEMCLCITVNANIGNFNNIAGEVNKNNNRVCKPITINQLTKFVAQNESYVNGGDYLSPANQCVGWNKGIKTARESLLIPTRPLGPTVSAAEIWKKAQAAASNLATEVALKRAAARQYVLQRNANKRK